MRVPLLVCAAVCFVAHAQAAMSFKGVLDAEGTITFYYDDVDHSAEGTVRTHTAGSTGYTPWKNDTSILKAVFTPSCSTFAWTKGLQYFFLGCSNLATVEGLGNLNTGSASSFLQMFKDCSSLVSLDSRYLKSPNVTNFADMFYNCVSLEVLDISSLSSASAGQCGNAFRNCPLLKTVYVRDGFDLSGLASQWVFTSTSKIVGGNGTTWSSSNVHATYARIDKDGSPGYFTLKTQTLTVDASDFAAKHIVSVAVTLASDGSTLEPDTEGGSVWTIPKGTAVVITYAAAAGYEFSGNSTFEDTSFASDGILDDVTLEGNEIPSASAFVRCVLTIDTTDFEAQHVAGVAVKSTATGATIPPEANGTYSLVPSSGFEIVYRATAGRFFGNYISITNDQTYATSGISADTTVSALPRAGIQPTSTHIKGVVSDADPTTMTFYCDDIAHEGIVYARKAATGYPSWASVTNILRVVVDSSMRTNRYGDGGDGFQYLFYGLSSVTNIEGLCNLKTDKATNFTQMFARCGALTELDLSSFRTPRVRYYGEMFRYCSSLRTVDISRFTIPSEASVSCGYMFNGCAALTTIYTRADLDFNDVSQDDYMFTGCNKLVGGNGTKAITNIQHYKSYAHVDVPGNPGYFTLKAQTGCFLLIR